MYARGQGVPQSDTEAVKWLRKAAAQGDADAQFNLGLMYDMGEGVPENDAEAVHWFRKAAEQGDADAQFYLGRIYFLGEGVTEDFTLAYKWFNLARLGSGETEENAQMALALITPKMTTEQIAEAQKLATEWWEAHQGQ